MKRFISVVFFLFLAIALSGSIYQQQVTSTVKEELNINDFNITPTPVKTTLTLVEDRMTVENPTYTRVPTPTPTPTPTQVSLPYVECPENGEDYICFGDYYKELPKTGWEDNNIIPKYIVLHWDGRPEKPYNKWLSTGTWFGLGSAKSSHFGVGIDGVGQFLPMFVDSVKQSKAADNWVFDAQCINIEIAGRNFNAIVNGEADDEMKTTIETVTNFTLELVVKLMRQYNISIENVLGHYQVLNGKVDPGDLWLQEYFLPKLRNLIEK